MLGDLTPKTATKKCSRCGINKVTTEFYQNPCNSVDGLQAACRVCCLKDQREQRASARRYGVRMRLQMTDTERAWVAGLLEGEGCFLIGTERGARGDGISTDGRPLAKRVEIMCGMTDEDIIRKLHRITGMGRVYVEPSTKPGRKQMFRWHCRIRSDVLELLKAIRPHMGQRRTEKIDLLLSTIDNSAPLRTRRW